MIRTVFRVIVVLAALAVVGFASCRYVPPKSVRDQAIYPTQLENEPTIRIMALETVEPLTLEITGAYDLQVIEPDGSTNAGGGNRVAIRVTPVKGGVQVGDARFRKATVIPRGGTKLVLSYHVTDSKGQRVLVRRVYPGSLTFVRRDGATDATRVIVEVGLEAYLVGVVPSEMPVRWPAEALKAQAITSRTFALYQIKTRGKKDFDVTATVMSQVWRPSNRPEPRAVMAVNTTRGVVMTENYRLFPAHFHSACGGHTADARYVYGYAPLTVLSGTDCPYCQSKGAPAAWNFVIAKAELMRRLAKKEGISGRLRTLYALDEFGQRRMSMMGRAYTIELVMESGTRHSLPASRFRLAIGHDRENLPSTWFKVSQSGDEITFIGQGYGHGVGLCQHGAKYLAETKGEYHEDILSTYYPNALLVKLY